MSRVNLILFILATVIFFLLFGSRPDGYFWDTGGILLNALCLRDFGVDEYGSPWPLVIRSFGDNKAALYTYFHVAVFSLLPPGLLAMRLISMLMAYLSVLGFLVYFVRHSGVFPVPRWKYFWGFAFIAFLLSSWVWAVARFPVEPTLVPPIMLGLLILSHRFMEKPHWIAAMGLGLLLGLSVYAYHSFKVLFFAFWPLLVVCQVLGKQKIRRGFLVLGMMTSLLIAWPFLRDLSGEAEQLGRLKQIWLAPETAGSVGVGTFLKSLFKHISPVFWFIKGDGNKRHHFGFLGELSLLLAPFFYYGVWKYFREKIYRNNPFITFILGLMGLSFIPASILPEGVPHALRTSTAVFPIYLFALFGYFGLEKDLLIRKIWRGFLALALLGHLSVLIWLIWVYPERSRNAWQDLDSLARIEQTPRIVLTESHSPGDVFNRLFLVMNKQVKIYCHPPKEEP